MANNEAHITVPVGNTFPNFTSDIKDFLDSTKVTNTDSSQIRIAQVVKIDLPNNTIDIFVLADKDVYTVEYPGHMVDWQHKIGMWYGLSLGDIVLCTIGYGNKYLVLDRIGNSISEEQLNGFSDGTDLLVLDSLAASQDADFKNILPGDFLIKSKNDVKLKLSQNEVILGNEGKGSLTFDLTEKNSSQGGSATFESNQKYEFDNSGYSIEGIVLRDRRITELSGNTDLNVNSRILFQWYKDLQSVAFDPSLQSFEKTTESYPRNPSFVEKRNVVFEFSDYKFDNIIESDKKESEKQSIDKTQQRNPSLSRRARKSDSFSLSLISPNYLIEEIKGTAVDALGNIIDINRTIIPIGEHNGIAKLEGNAESYYKVRELQRKSIAFHWELNARKDQDKTLKIETGAKETYGGTDDVYKKNRSRFFLDIDKEGQLKLNVPASSETGNISVLARYENYTNINPDESSGKKDYDFFKRTSKTDVDILLDSVGTGVVDLIGNDKLLPNDRITNTKVKLGTMYHDISTTCIYPFRDKDDPDRIGFGILSGPDTIIEDFTGIKRDVLRNTIPEGASFEDRTIITKTINIDGDSANAGGRSATLNFEGMINTSIGANTVDRQSLWLDTQGGIIARIGADINGISSATQTDGDVYLQIGGQSLSKNGLDPDNRFQDPKFNDTVLRTNRLEIRVMQGNGPSFSKVLIDNRGIIFSTPENMEFRADKDVFFYTGGNIFLNTESIKHYMHTLVDDSIRASKQSRNLEDVYETDAGKRIVQRGLEFVNC